jgi:hypothetical protein
MPANPAIMVFFRKWNGNYNATIASGCISRIYVAVALLFAPHIGGQNSYSAVFQMDARSWLFRSRMQELSKDGEK